ncbi:MAG TPA: TIGR01244 family sulfur transferase [Sphingomicrobium sp.]|nr:TIGR01244 family sulfur transferase [Sphingomicrobium sp.]
MIRQLDERILVSGQVAPHEVAGLAGEGVTMLVNNRPDGEEPGQPLASAIEEAAAQAGIAYRFVPIIRGIGPADVEAMQDALKEAEGGKLLAFCRSGTRSALVAALAKRERGSSAEEVSDCLVSAGFDPCPIAHLL